MSTSSTVDDLPPGAEPLAARLRPSSIDTFVGQQHLLAADKPLGRVLASGRLHSMVLWGPPGCGKTTLAQLLCGHCDYRWQSLSAVLSGVKDIRAAVEQARVYAQQGSATVLFIDEVHRFNKAQQDAFLPHVESGVITLIGATTENPAFELNSALLSRARVYVLKPLAQSELQTLLARAVRSARHADSDAELGELVSDEALLALADLADGDARMGLNLLDIAAQLADARIELDHVRTASGTRLRRFDHGGDAFYDQISALHKAVRGSAPDAALYWFARMLDGGCDPKYLARRLTRMASEDIGLADPRALSLCLDAWQTYDRLGSPEGELALAQALTYLASCPKSNAAYRAFGAAQALVADTGSQPVPERLRNAPTRLAKEMGHGAGYRYAHDEPDAYAAGESYWPDAMPAATLYEPNGQGLEHKIGERLRRLRALDESARANDKGKD
ncbi:MAG: replication-associated recombination protein A [Pseudomonadales bacterium]